VNTLEATATAYLQTLVRQGFEPSHVEAMDVKQNEVGLHLHADVQTYIHEQLAAQRYDIENITPQLVNYDEEPKPEPESEPDEPNEPLPEPTSEPLPAPQAGPLFLLRSGRRFFYDAKGPQLLFTHDLKLAKKVTADEGRAMEYVIEVYHGQAIDLVPMEAL